MDANKDTEWILLKYIDIIDVISLIDFWERERECVKIIVFQILFPSAMYRGELDDLIRADLNRMPWLFWSAKRMQTILEGVCWQRGMKDIPCKYCERGEARRIIQ